MVKETDCHWQHLPAETHLLWYKVVLRDGLDRDVQDNIDTFVSSHSVDNVSTLFESNSGPILQITCKLNCSLKFGVSLSRSLNHKTKCHKICSTQTQVV